MKLISKKKSILILSLMLIFGIIPIVNQANSAENCINLIDNEILASTELNVLENENWDFTSSTADGWSTASGSDDSDVAEIQLDNDLAYLKIDDDDFWAKDTNSYAKISRTMPDSYYFVDQSDTVITAQISYQIDIDSDPTSKSTMDFYIKVGSTTQIIYLYSDSRSDYESGVATWTQSFTVSPNNDYALDYNLELGINSGDGDNELSTRMRMWIYSVNITADVTENPPRPTNPTSASTTLLVNDWNEAGTYSITFVGAQAGIGAQIGGYSYTFEQNQGNPDEVVDSTSDTISVSPDAQGDWYLNVKTMNNYGKWASNVEHFGPYQIDKTGPTIDTIYGFVSSLDEDEEQTIYCDITDDETTIDYARLYFKINDGSWAYNDMPFTGDRADGLISNTLYNWGDTVSYYIEAKDHFNNYKYATGSTFTTYENVVLTSPVTFSVTEDDDPVIGNPGVEIDPISESEGQTLSCNISDAKSGIDYARINYRAGSGAWKYVTMSFNGNTATGTIPSSDYTWGQSVYYYISAVDNHGNALYRFTNGTGTSGTTVTESSAQASPYEFTLFDVTPPSLSGVSLTTSPIIVEFEDQTVRCTSIDTGAGLDWTRLYYRIGTIGDFNMVEMSLSGSSASYTFDSYPIASTDLTYEYYIGAKDNMDYYQYIYSGGATTANNATASASPYSFIVADNILPTIDRPAHLTQLHYTDFSSLTWTVTDTYNTGVKTYCLTKDDVIIQTGTWESGSQITYDVSEDTPVGEYLFRLEVFDGYENESCWATTLTIENRPPNLRLPTGDEFEPDDQFRMTITDMSAMNDHGSYNVFLDGKLYLTGAWDEGAAVPIDIPISSLEIGEHTITVNITDGYGGSAEKSKTFTIIDGTSIFEQWWFYVATVGGVAAVGAGVFVLKNRSGNGSNPRDVFSNKEGSSKPKKSEFSFDDADDEDFSSKGTSSDFGFDDIFDD